jgi:hypothetical protein
LKEATEPRSEKYREHHFQSNRTLGTTKTTHTLDRNVVILVNLRPLRRGRFLFCYARHRRNNKAALDRVLFVLENLNPRARKVLYLKFNRRCR